MSELNKTATALLAELLMQNKQQFELISKDIEKLSNATSCDALKNKITELEAKNECLERENQELKQSVNQLMDEKELQQTRMSKYLLGYMSHDDIKREYQKEFKALETMYKKYNFDTTAQQNITYHISYTKIFTNNNWFVKIHTNDVIKGLGIFLEEYFGLTIFDPVNGNLRLEIYLQEHIKDNHYTFRCSTYTLDNYVIPLTNYSRIYPQYSLMNYELDMMNHHTITFNGEKYTICFPFNKISGYQEYQNIAAYIAYNTSNPDTNYEELRHLDLTKEYDDGTDIIVEISKQRFINYYVPKFKPTQETLLKLLNY